MEQMNFGTNRKIVVQLEFDGIHSVSEMESLEYFLRGGARSNIAVSVQTEIDFID
jgi:hypothetical protein